MCRWVLTASSLSQRLLKSTAVKRDQTLASLIAAAIVFAFVVGVAGIHGWFGVARATITVALAGWFLFSDRSGRLVLIGIPKSARGWLRAGVTGLMVIEIVRVVTVMTRVGVAPGDIILLVLDLVIFGLLVQSALVDLDKTPGGLILGAAFRARNDDPAKALRLATRATTLYRKWDEAWILRATLAGEQLGEPERAIVLRRALRYCSRNTDMRDALISTLYATGATDEAETMLEEYRTLFPRSCRPLVIDAVNAMTGQEEESARALLIEARQRALKEWDYEGLRKIAFVSTLLPDRQDRAIGTDGIQSALRKDPRSSDLQVLLAILIEDEQPVRAQALLDQARASWRPTTWVKDFDEYVDGRRRSAGPRAPGV